MRQRFEDLRSVTRLFAGEAYNEAEGNPFKARQLFRAKTRAYGLDPMTIIMLIQIAIKIWAWAKENGFLKSMPIVATAAEPQWILTEDNDFEDDTHE